MMNFRNVCLWTKWQSNSVKLFMSQRNSLKLSSNIFNYTFNYILICFEKDFNVDYLL